MKKTRSGEVPINWRVTKLGKYVNQVSQRNNKENPPVLSVTNTQGFVISEKFFDRKVYSKDLSNYKVIKKGQFAYNPSRVNVGSISRLQEFEHGLLSPMYVVFETKDGLDGEYLDYWIKSQRFRNLVKVNTQGTVRDSLNFSALANFPFALPPLPEQHKISEILFSVDAVIEHTQAVIDQTQTLKKGMMQELLTRGIPGRHKKFKETEIGKIPEEWKVARLGELSTDGINNGIFKKKHQYGKGILLVNVFNTYGSLCVNPLTLDRVEASKEEINKFGLTEGDLLFVRSSLKYEGVGQCCMVSHVDEPMVYECHLMRVRANQDKVVPLFLAFYCNSSMFRCDLFSNAKMQTMTTLAQSDIASLCVPLPTIKEQKKITSILENCDIKINKNNMLKENLQDLKSALMYVLLTGEVRVKA